MPAPSLISHAPHRLLRFTLALAALSLPFLSLSSAAHAEDTNAAPIPERQAAVAAPPSPPSAPLVVATAPPPPPPRVLVATEPEPEHTYVVLIRANSGVVVVPGRPAGGYGGFGFDYLFNAERHRTKPIWGMGAGWEFFGLRRNGSGGGFNIELHGGLKSTHVIATVTAGVNVFTFDSFDHRGGAGIFSPRAGARIGFLLDGYYLGAGAQVQRRWQWEGEDVTMITAGLVFGGGGESTDTK